MADTVVIAVIVEGVVNEAPMKQDATKRNWRSTLVQAGISTEWGKSLALGM